MAKINEELNDVKIEKIINKGFKKVKIKMRLDLVERLLNDKPFHISDLNRCHNTSELHDENGIKKPSLSSYESYFNDHHQQYTASNHQKDKIMHNKHELDTLDKMMNKNSESSIKYIDRDKKIT